MRDYWFPLFFGLFFLIRERRENRYISTVSMPLAAARANIYLWVMCIDSRREPARAMMVMMKFTCDEDIKLDGGLFPR